MQQPQEIPEQRLVAAAVSRAQAEHVEWTEMLHYAERLEAEYSASEEYFARVEADLFNERAEAERTPRRVDITHGDDAMS